MKARIITVFGLAILTVLSSCKAPQKPLASEEYLQSIATWDSTRLQSLKSKDGWLNLAGLFWLQEGENTLGSGSENTLLFPRGPEKIGAIIFTDGKTTFVSHEGVEVLMGEETIPSVEMLSDKEGRPTRLEVDSLSFYVIKRGERTGIRLRDYKNPKIEALQHIDRFPPDTSWIIKAKFLENTTGMTISVPDVLGDVSVEKVPGILEFNFDGGTYRLYPTGTRERLFLVFGDDTNALETYGAGRFLSVEKPDSLGFVNIDFNKAYNPPCAFSEFATCPHPARENMLPFKVKAGEKAVPH